MGMTKQDESKDLPPHIQPTTPPAGHIPAPGMKPEFGGRKGVEATRYGDWEMNGKCVDF